MSALGKKYEIRTIPPWTDVEKTSSKQQLAFSKTVEARFFQSGRAALHHILLTLAGQSSRNTLLVPAYICNSVTQACLHTGFKVSRYRMSGPLRPDENDLAKKIDNDTAAVIVTHFFGFIAPVQSIKMLCAKSGVSVIEDAAHVDLHALGTGAAVGVHGDWLIGSIRKFADVYDGAVALALNTSSFEKSVSVANMSIGSELRSLKYFLSVFFESRGLAKPALGQELPTAGTLADGSREELSPSSSDATTYIDNRFDLSHSHSMTFVSERMVGHVDRRAVRQVRRSNYERISEAIAQYEGCEALYPSLEPGAIPYVFPLLLKSPEQSFTSLRASTMEVLRWENLGVHDCELSKGYETRLVQIPCHQGLSGDQLLRIEGILRSILE